jgi:hypothetical protein
MGLVKRKPMTDEQALEVLKSLEIAYSRGSSKTVFSSIVLEAFSHAYKALEEKIENKPPHNTRK